jgi:methylornithine synthase
MSIDPAQLKEVLSEIQQGRRLRRDECLSLLSLEQESDINLFFKTARQLRQKHFGNKVFTYGFAYTSTFCRNNCRFCYFRQTNVLSQRYRKKEADVLQIAQVLSQEGVHLIDVTMGEDPLLHELHNGVPDKLVQLINDICKQTGLPVMVSPGVISDALLKGLADAGATWYACYQETHNPLLFSKLRSGQNYEERLAKKYLAKKLGLLIEEGILCGVGETDEDIADSIEAMKNLDADQIRVMKFIPQPGTPMAKFAETDSLRECLIIALLRLSFPDRLIPASLDVDGLAGLKMRLDAGANVITSLVPPDYGLAGVAHHELDIENANRTMTGIKPVLKTAGLHLAEQSDYLRWIKIRQQANS